MDEVTFAEWDACVAAGGCGHVKTEALLSRPATSLFWARSGAQRAIYTAWATRNRAVRSALNLALLTADAVRR